MKLIAKPRYALPGPGMDLVPASANRQWMDDTLLRFAYRCLPLSIANQAGWVVTNPLTFTATWDGKAGVVFHAEDEEAARRWQPFIGALYGGGVIGVRLPWAFGTEAGHGLLVRGPANHGVPGALAMDAFYDTADALVPIAAEWKLLKANEPVTFPQGTPLAFLMPYPLDLLEEAVTALTPLKDNAELKAAFYQWSASRRNFLADPGRKDGDWQKDYFQGKDQAGGRKHGHKTRLHLAEFQEP